MLYQLDANAAITTFIIVSLNVFVQSLYKGSPRGCKRSERDNSTLKNHCIALTLVISV